MTLLHLSPFISNSERKFIFAQETSIFISTDLIAAFSVNTINEDILN